MSEQNSDLLHDIEEEYDSFIKDQYLTFEIDKEDYGISIENIKEIISITAITEVPHTEDYIKGIINLRGDILPVIDIRRRFLKQERPYDELTCIVIVEYKSYVLGLIVDQVKEVFFINDKNIETPPNAKLKFENQFIKNIGRVDEDIKLILDIDRLLIEF